MSKINIPHDHPIIICLFKEASSVIEDIIREYVAQHFDVVGESKDTMLEELEAAAYAAIYAAWDAAAAPYAGGNAMLGCSKTIFIRASANNTRVEIQQSKECFLQQVQQVQHEPKSGIYIPVMITLNKINEASLSDDGWEKVLKAHKHLGMDTPFPLSSVLDSNGLEDTVWCFEVLPEHIEIPKRFAIWCAREIQHLMTDEHSVNALDIAERYLDGDATLEEFIAATARAVRAADYATAATAADSFAAAAAYAAARAARADTFADTFADSAAYAVDAAVDAAYAATAAAAATADSFAAAAYAAARDARAVIEKKQIDKLREMLDAA